ncbi:MAG: hypothetical protein JJ958_06770 [Balneola sp.]|nr:hypothetical protein [Balneola sp.]
MLELKLLKNIYGVYLILQSQNVELVTQAFDKAFSIGLLMVGLIIIWKSNQKANEYNQMRDQKFEAVLERTTAALENNNALMRRINEKLDKI